MERVKAIKYFGDYLLMTHDSIQLLSAEQACAIHKAVVESREDKLPAPNKTIERTAFDIETTIIDKFLKPLTVTITDIEGRVVDAVKIAPEDRLTINYVCKN